MSVVTHATAADSAIDAIVIGGGISKAGDRLFEPLRAELRRQITDWSGARIDLMPAALGDDSVLWGALALAEEAA